MATQRPWPWCDVLCAAGRYIHTAPVVSMSQSAHEAGFAATHAGPQEQADDAGDVAGQIGQRVVDDGFGDGPDGFGFARLSAAALQTAHGFQAEQHRRRHQFIFGAPLPHAANAADALIDDASRQRLLRAALGMRVTLHHQRADGLQGQWPKGSGGGCAVQVNEGAHG